jgi:hypothetical protein
MSPTSSLVIFGGNRIESMRIVATFFVAQEKRWCVFVAWAPAHYSAQFAVNKKIPNGSRHRKTELMSHDSARRWHLVRRMESANEPHRNRIRRWTSQDLVRT